MTKLKDEISLELITNIAAKLLKGEDYKKAAKRDCRISDLGEAVRMIAR